MRVLRSAVGRVVRRVERAVFGRGLVLLYHRIAEVETDPWSLAVTPRHFAEHLQVLAELARPVPLGTLVERTRAGRVPRCSVAVTFDDGYLDNLVEAKPLLERHGVPATVFVPTGRLDGGSEFWWDELATLLLTPGALPERVTVRARDRSFEWELASAASCGDAELRAHREWRAWETPPGPRQALYRNLWELLHPLDEEERESVLEQVRAVAAPPGGSRTLHPLLSEPQVAELAAGEGIEIGGHTVTHPSLAALPAERQRFEIEVSRARLEQVTGRPVRTFAYPFGKHHDYTAETVSIVRGCGFAGAFTNVAGAVDTRTDPYRVPRIFVTDMDGDAFAAELARWLPLRSRR